MNYQHNQPLDNQRASTFLLNEQYARGMSFIPTAMQPVAVPPSPSPYNPRAAPQSFPVPPENASVVSPPARTVQSNPTATQQKPRSGGAKITRDEETLLLNACCARAELYESVNQRMVFWKTVAADFGHQVHRTYSHTSAKRRCDQLVGQARKEMAIERTGVERGDDDWHQALDQWVKVVDSQDAKEAAADARKKQASQRLLEKDLARHNLTVMGAEKRSLSDSSESDDDEIVVDSDDDRSAPATPGPTSQQRRPTKRRRRAVDQTERVAQSIDKMVDLYGQQTRAQTASTASPRLSQLEEQNRSTRADTEKLRGEVSELKDSVRNTRTHVDNRMDRLEETLGGKLDAIMRRLASDS